MSDRPRRRRWLAAPIAILVGLHILALAADASAAPQVQNLAPTGTEQLFTVPLGVTKVQVVAIGGRGGDIFEFPGGFGARAAADLSVRAGQVLYIEVATYGASSLTDPPAGFNGGGPGGNPWPGASGGGASDVRTLPTTGPDSLASRVIVAGGGGGGGGLYGGGGGAGAESMCSSMYACSQDTDGAPLASASSAAFAVPGPNELEPPPPPGLPYELNRLGLDS